MPYPEEDVIDPWIIYCDNIRLLCCQQAVVLKNSQSQLPYNSQECVYEEEDKVEGDYEEYGEFSLHQLAQEAELEQECLPDQEEEPEDEAEMHYHLDPTGIG